MNSSLKLFKNSTSLVEFTNSSLELFKNYTPLVEFTIEAIQNSTPLVEFTNSSLELFKNSTPLAEFTIEAIQNSTPLVEFMNSSLKLFKNFTPLVEFTNSSLKLLKNPPHWMSLPYQGVKADLLGAGLCYVNNLNKIYNLGRFYSKDGYGKRDLPLKISASFSTFPNRLYLLILTRSIFC